MQSINVRERRMGRKERERYGASFRPSHRLRACRRNRWIERPATDNRLQRGRTYFFQGRARYKIEREPRWRLGRVRSTAPFPSRSSFSVFSPQRRRRRRSPEAARSCDTRWVSLHGPNSISCGLLIFFPSSSPFSLPSFFSAMELRERGGGEGKEG